MIPSSEVIQQISSTEDLVCKSLWQEEGVIRRKPAFSESLRMVVVREEKQELTQVWRELREAICVAGWSSGYELTF